MQRTISSVDILSGFIHPVQKEIERWLIAPGTSFSKPSLFNPQKATADQTCTFILLIQSQQQGRSSSRRIECCLLRCNLCLLGRQLKLAGTRFFGLQ